MTSRSNVPQFVTPDPWSLYQGGFLYSQDALEPLPTMVMLWTTPEDKIKLDTVVNNSFFLSQTSMADVSQWNTEDKVIGEILHQFFLKTKELDKLMTPEDLANDLVIYKNT